MHKERGLGPFFFLIRSMTASARPPALAAMLALLAFTLLAHPYQGVFHDGILYFGQVLLNTRVPELGRDIFFQGGSQDRYSIYSPLMGFLYEHAGRQITHVSLLLASWLSMFVALAALLKRFLLTPLARRWGLLAFAVLSPIYGGCWIIAYTETFVTARTFAEPLLLWGVVALMDRRLWLAGALQILAASFHPLLALPIMAVSWCFLAGEDRRWLWLLAVIPVLLALGAAGVAPWDGLMKTYPPYWRALVETSNFLVQPLQWPLRDHLNVLLDLALLMVASRLGPTGDISRLLRAIVFTTLAMMALSILGADVLHAILLTQLQLWRAHWIAHLMAMALAPWVVMSLWRRGALWPASACALVLALLNEHAGTANGAAVLSLWAVTSLAAWRITRISQHIVRLVCIVISIGVLALAADVLTGQLQLLDWQSTHAVWSSPLAKMTVFPLLAFSVFAVLQYLAGKGWAGESAALVASGLLLTLAVQNWDQRTDISRAIEDPQTPTPHPFEAHLPPHANVYWPNELAPVWGLLERTSHYSQPQGAGLLFNRDTALLFGPRKEMYRLINQDRENCLTGALIARDLASRMRCLMPAPERLQVLCSNVDAPDFLVLPGLLSPAPLSTWQLPTYREPRQTFSLYACSQLKPKDS